MQFLRMRIAKFPQLNSGLNEATFKTCIFSSYTRAYKLSFRDLVIIIPHITLIGQSLMHYRAMWGQNIGRGSIQIGFSWVPQK